MQHRICVQVRPACSGGSELLHVQLLENAEKAADFILAICKLPKVSNELRRQLAAALSEFLKNNLAIMGYEALDLPEMVRQPLVPGKLCCVGEAPAWYGTCHMSDLPFVAAPSGMARTKPC